VSRFVFILGQDQSAVFYLNRIPGCPMRGFACGAFLLFAHQLLPGSPGDAVRTLGSFPRQAFYFLRAHSSTGWRQLQESMWRKNLNALEGAQREKV
jgi:hypothetical protein